MNKSIGCDTTTMTTTTTTTESETNKCLDENKIEEKRRKNYLEWTDYFMATAMLAAKRSKDPNTQVGACIVNGENIIISIGYNGLPIGCHDDDFPWKRTDRNPLNNKYMYVVHAEVNAILNKNAGTIQNCILYTTEFPCNECTKCIIQSGIKEIVYKSSKYEDQPSTIAAKRMLNAVGIKYTLFQSKISEIILDFN